MSRQSDDRFHGQIAPEGGGSEQESRVELAVVFGHLGQQHQELRGAHRIAGEVEVVGAGLLQNEVYKDRVIEQGALLEAEIPISGAGGASFEGGVISRVLISPHVRHPNVEAFVGQLVG